MDRGQIIAPPLFHDMEEDIRVAHNGEKIVRVSAWQLWPPRRSLDGLTKLCRWCAKPLEHEWSYCGEACRLELWTRASLPMLRQYIFDREKGICQRCGLNVGDLKEASLWIQRKQIEIGQRDLDNWKYTGHWPTPRQLLAAMGFKTGHLWEVNHSEAIGLGGDPVDVAKMELLCEICHRLHTAQVVKTLAKAKRIRKKFHNGLEV